MKTSARDKKSKSAKTGAKPSVKTEKAATLIVEAITEKPPKAEVRPVDKFRKFFLWNVWLAALYGVQGIAILLFSDTKVAQVTTEYLSQDKLASSLADKPVFATASQHLFDVNLAQLLAVTLFVIALTHLVAATVVRKRYEAGLEGPANKLRWMSNALSGGAFVTLIAMLVGVTNAGTLAMLFTLTALSFIAALVMELDLRLGRKSKFLCGLGIIAGLVPGIVVGLVLLGAGIWGESNIPAYLYWLVGTAAATALAIATLTFWHHKKTGKWADYLYYERAYLAISLVANTALAWQIFAGALRP